MPKAPEQIWRFFYVHYQHSHLCVYIQNLPYWKQEVDDMKQTKYYFTIDEWRCLVSALNDMRNKYIAEGRHTDFLDEVLMKLLNAKTQRVRVRPGA
jgi:hypothetical protein